ncbi:ATP-binding cassette domain-containing protein [Candidatus Fermentibacteria bacterium]|nr:ATP-binding cassette domain-containing protein [Candidatus Fermentibacteria bacterium]
MSGSCIEVVDLQKHYPTRMGLRRIRAVEGISFSLRNGDILGFLGPNGAGKTTTIKCILGLLRPTSGSVRLWGEPPAAAKVRQRIGFVPENPTYESCFTPLEFLRTFSEMRGLDQGSDFMLGLLGRVGLSGWETTRIDRFSKGMRQRLSLALALQSQPDVLVLDEPTGGLDPLARKEFRDIILEESRRGAAVFLSSHLLSEVEAICDRAVILSQGRKVSEGSMEELLRKKSPYTIRFSLPGSTPVEKRLEGGESELQKEIDSIRRRDGTILAVERTGRSLEEVFLEVTGEER